ncbi:bifunctional isocitrate dehydrogenase kinase/phosphatase [Paucibacter sp. DJ1R-11]|uniref:bifunctional isocitrate dehydrogenase kinase/phosphatase n=1 Tax=Paucibacter sp. DJ1R-11 TaxID=2893556 RepID=UPI0021E456C6|nr:bifunctional isocitrate dehydrogenase kinase/phosphatase [Paucibacter sp. DJ1R-11]MCV2361909.1 bifunctional isocitrate dehydrogenase kinase/phosphatase [Paucibacter sp. DJ1R-11]
MFPQKLTDARAFEIAQTLLGGFDRHYQLFSATSAAAKQRFERADWQGQQRAQALRIEFYEQRVDETVALLEARFQVGQLAMDVWQQVKLHFIGLLIDHLQPELAETFFNSVCTRILHRGYFHNSFLFVRPAVSTEYIENEEPAARATYRAYYPTPQNLRDTWCRVLTNFQLDVEFEDLGRDVDLVLQAVQRQLGDFRWRANFQIQVLSSLFYRNKGAYLVGKIINGFTETPFALPILHAEPSGLLRIDAALFGEDDLLMLFSFARAYFMVDMAVPSACVQFLRSLMPRKPRAELYSAIGLQKHGKNLFYRDLLAHLRHSSDKFRIAPGIKGMVMLVFDLPSYPFVFKLIKDFYPPQKEHTTRELIQSKYLLVKQHDRVGRMADTLEFSNVALPRHRFDEELLAELRHFCPSLLEEEGDKQGGEHLVLRHVYIERRMVPLNIYLQEATPAQLEHAVIEYGNAIKDLLAANIFPGDMLWKNFGVTRHGKVVFYDYDEIEYMTDCKFRRVPAPRNEEEEMSGEIWYAVGPRDVFPETFGPFLLGHPGVREVFMRHHADLLDPEFWQRHQQRTLDGHVHDVFPYDPQRRFLRVFAEGSLLTFAPSPLTGDSHVH